MAIQIYDVLQKNFVGAGLADGADLFNIVTSVEWSEDTKVLVVQSKDGQGNEGSLRVDFSNLGGAGGGLSEDDVRYLIGQVSEAWSLQGNADLIPTNKLAVSTSSAPGVIQIATDAEATAGTIENKAVNPKQLKANAGSGGGLNTAAVDARIQPFARTGNTDDVPSSKLPDATPSQKGIFEIADQNDADTGTSTLHAMTPALTKRRIDAATTGAAIKGKLEGLSGSARLDASSIKNLPSAGSGTETGATIKSKLEGLSGNARLDASAVKNLPSGGGITATQLNNLDHIKKVTALPTSGLGSTYPSGSVIRYQDKFYELVTAAASHGIRVSAGQDGNYHGYNRVDDDFSENTGHAFRESGQDLRGNVVGGFFTNLSNGQVTTFLALSSPPGTIYARVYSGTPGNTNEVFTDAMRRSSGGDVTKGGITYRKYVSGSGVWDRGDNPPDGFYVRFFTRSPQTSDQASNPLNIFAANTWHAISSYEPKRPATDAHTNDALDFPVWANDPPVLEKISKQNLATYVRSTIPAPPAPPTAYSPRRLTSIPSANLKGDKFYLTAESDRPRGVEITPVSFAGTELDGLGIGDRGWYSKPDAGFQVGSIRPSLPDDFVLISDERFYVKRNTQTDLTHLLLDTVRYAVVRRPQAAGHKILSSPEYAASQPDVDYYTITGGLPSGDWDNLRFLRSNGTYVPADAKDPVGPYYDDGTDVQRDEYTADAANLNNDLKFMVQERQPGGKTGKTLNFTASGSNFTVTNPFPKILRITYNNTSSDSDLYRRYSLDVPLANYDDSRAPKKLEINGRLYPAQYLETHTNYATYITSATTASNQRISSAGNVNNCNVQYRNNEWANNDGDKLYRRTLEGSELSKIAGEALPSYILPPHPVDGELIRCLSNISFDRGAVMTAEEENGFIGYKANVGDLESESDGIEEIGAYVGGSTPVANRVAVKRASGNTKSPSKLDISDGRQSWSFTLVSAGQNYWYSNNLAVDNVDEVRHFFVANHQYLVQVTYTDGTKEFSAVNFQSGDVIIWANVIWRKISLGLPDVQNLIDSTLRQRNIKNMWFGTSTQYDAITVKDANTVYYVR